MKIRANPGLVTEEYRGTVLFRHFLNVGISRLKPMSDSLGIPLVRTHQRTLNAKPYAPHELSDARQRHRYSKTTFDQLTNDFSSPERDRELHLSRVLRAKCLDKPLRLLLRQFRDGSESFRAFEGLHPSRFVLRKPPMQSLSGVTHHARQFRY